MIAAAVEVRGSQVDPDVVEAFLAAREEFQRIAEHFTHAEPAVA
jgi:response regulator RpfG family c-di-GMP phosphodiesterase